MRMHGLGVQRHQEARPQVEGREPMNFSDYAELEKRAEAHGLGDDPSLAQLLHIIQFKEAVVNGHKRTMRELAAWEKNIAETVEQHIKETEAADGQ